MGKAKAPIMSWLPVVGLAWFVPGGGHFLLKRTTRAYVLSGTILVAFVAGLLMRGTFFSPQSGDLFTTLIYWGGFFANLASGIFYFLAIWLGYAQPDVAGHVHDYGTKFLAAAGLMNIMAIVDAYEIAIGRRQ